VSELLLPLVSFCNVFFVLVFVLLRFSKNEAKSISDCQTMMTVTMIVTTFMLTIMIIIITTGL